MPRVAPHRATSTERTVDSPRVPDEAEVMDFSWSVMIARPCSGTKPAMAAICASTVAGLAIRP